MKFDEYAFEKVADALLILNRDVIAREFGSKERLIEYMKSETMREMHEPGYWGTAGFYISVYRCADGVNLGATASVSATLVLDYIEKAGKIVADLFTAASTS